MRRWSEVAERVAATTKTSEKTAILAEYLASLDAEALPIAAVFLTGRAFPEADQRTIGPADRPALRRVPREHGERSRVHCDGRSGMMPT